MLIKIADPSFQTILFSVIFLCLLVVSIRKESGEFFSKNVTNQLKGLSILAIIFTHTGYFLSSPNQFLYPLSVLGGVGVNLFLFLSGFGLSLSHLKFPLSFSFYYKKRLSKLFIPLWIVIIIVLLIDNFALARIYPVPEIIRSFLGFYPRADLWQNLDSPLWYFSIIFFYYLIFPLTFIRKIPLLSPVLVLIISLLVLNLPLPVNPDVLKLYKLHFLAFPLGMLFGITIQNFKFKLNKILKVLIIIISIFIFLYTAINSGVGQDPKIEQSISLITALSLVAIFTLSRLEFRLFALFGIFSYEIYLFHWPILSRFNLFLNLPPFLMVILNLFLFIILGLSLQKIIRKAIT